MATAAIASWRPPVQRSLRRLTSDGRNLVRRFTDASASSGGAADAAVTGASWPLIGVGEHTGEQSMRGSNEQAEVASRGLQLRSVVDPGNHATALRLGASHGRLDRTASSVLRRRRARTRPPSRFHRLHVEAELQISARCRSPEFGGIAAGRPGLVGVGQTETETKGRPGRTKPVEAQACG